MANTDMFKYLSRNSPRFGVPKRGRAIPGVKVVESPDAKKSAASGGGPATRKIAGEVGSGAEVTYPRYQVPTGVEAGEQEIYTDENVPAEAPSERVSTPEMITERQGAITNRALGPRYERGTILGDLLGNLSSPKANPNFDPDKPIGGENVPYQSTSGLRGIFQRLGGNTANELNLGAQAEQASEWKAESALEKARKAKIEDYRIQKGIDAEIANASDEKKRAHEVSMLEKTQQAHREVIKAQQDFTAAQNDKERAEAWKRLESAQNHAVSMQNTALAATAAEGAAGRQLQTDIANLRTRSDDFLARNAVHFGPNGQFSRGGAVYNMPSAVPGQKATPELLLGPAGEGPQVNVGGAGGITPPRSGYSLGAGIDTPQQLPPGGGVRLGGVTPAAATAAATPAAPVTAEPARFGPFLMEEFQKRAQTLAKESGSRPNATDPLMLPMYENVAKSLGVQSEGVGASRQVRRPPAAIVENDLNSYLSKFGELPEEEQNAAVLDALNKSMKQPRYRTTPNWEYNYNPQ